MADFAYLVDQYIPIVEVRLEGKRSPVTCRFVVDTGCGLTIVDTPQLDLLGYSAQADAIGPYRTTSAIGIEHGYRLRLHCLEVFGKRFANIEVAALDLPRKYNVHGLIGMNILNQFVWCLHPAENVFRVQ